jgi:hypothetical protein
MPRGKQTKGQCVYCGEAKIKSQMTKHLATCQKRQETITRAESKRGIRQNLYHLRVQDTWGGEFWLDLGARLGDVERPRRILARDLAGVLRAFEPVFD